MAERLPTLYPMPRDAGQFWNCLELARKRLRYEEYLQEIRPSLKYENDQEIYTPQTVKRLLANLVTSTGFLRQESDPSGANLIVPPDHAALWREQGDIEGFRKYVGETIKRWSHSQIGFYPGIVLANDILAILIDSSVRQRDVLPRLSATGGFGGRYDAEYRYAARTVQEFLKLLKFANWVDEEDGKLFVTPTGRRARGILLKKDILLESEKLLMKLGPGTDGFTAQEKIAMSKYYMYRQCGGKGKDSSLGGAVATALYRNPDAPLHQIHTVSLQKALRAHSSEKRSLLTEIRNVNTAIAHDSEGIRNPSRLRLIRDLCVAGKLEQAIEAVQSSGGRFSLEALKQLRHSGPAYTMRPGFRPYAWQIDALKEWHTNANRGVLKVVTGAGKTIAALLAIRDLVGSDRNLRVTVLVPTKVLMYQWATELVRLLAVPIEEIGLRGDGHKDSFASGKRVMVTIVNSAILQSYLTKDVNSLALDTKHLLIADECHRYSGDEFQKVFRCRFDWSLGLSATPSEKGPDLSHDSSSPGTSDSPLGPEIFNYSYRKALIDGIIQSYTVKYYGVDLTPPERADYDGYTKKIAKTLDRIRQRYGPRLEAMNAPSLDQKLQTILNSDQHPDPSIFDYFRFVRERKDLVFGSLNRRWCYLTLIQKHSRDKVIVFHERIDDLQAIVSPMDRRELERSAPDESFTEKQGPVGDLDPNKARVDRELEELFIQPSFRPVMYHSGHHRQAWNQIGMEWFRDGTANVMLSVKALIEGVDVPTASVGIVRTSSSSGRQRIQTTGRILRKALGKTESVLYVIYVVDSSDERIFKDVNLAEALGSEAIESYHWTPPNENTGPEGHLTDRQIPTPRVWDEEPVDVNGEELNVGERYPGKYAGYEYHVDARGRPYRRTKGGKVLIRSPEVLEAAVRLLKLKGGGKFVVSPQGHIVTKVKGRGLIYLGIVSSLQFEDATPLIKKRAPGKSPTFQDVIASLS
jgi:superfamily II DNA or RNA helicase